MILIHEKTRIQEEIEDTIQGDIIDQDIEEVIGDMEIMIGIIMRKEIQTKWNRKIIEMIKRESEKIMKKRWKWTVIQLIKNKEQKEIIDVED